VHSPLYAIKPAKNILKAALMHVKLEVIHKFNKPYGIRDSSGFLFFFPQITKYHGQEERYRDEIFEQFKLADFLLCALRGRAAENQGMAGFTDAQQAQ